MACRYSPIAVMAVLYIVLCILLRCVLLYITPDTEQFASFITLMGSFIIGICVDIVTASYIFVLWFVLIACMPFAWLHTRWYTLLTYGIATCYCFFFYFVFASEIIFWDEFTSRFNFIAVDYLIYTTEVIQNIQESYPVAVIISGIVMLSIATVYLLRPLLSVPAVQERIQRRVMVPVMYLCFVLITSFGMSSSSKDFSTNTLNNALAGNGVYEFVSAFFNNELNYQQFYKTIPLEEAIRIVKEDLMEEGAVFIDPLSSPSFYHKRIYEGAQKNYNMILVVVESLSSKYLTRFGEQRNITPFLDKLSQECLFFSNLFATGTRTVRGLEALSLSIPPTPGQSIVRRKNNTDLITMGQILRSAGYETYFYYGGYGYFDNMNAYFEGNSYAVQDRMDVPDDKIAFGNVWGIADESLFDAVIRSVDEYTSGVKNNAPFFYTVLTTSNHRPFTYPDGRIGIPSGEGRHGAVRYTDWALEDFITKASSKPWFKNTIFVIIADHTASGAGKTTLPLRRYHIPMFIYAPHLIEAREFSTLTSQIDVIPTLLGLLNVSYTSSFMGYDMLRLSSTQKTRAFIGTYQNLGYFADDVLTILEPKEGVLQEHANTQFIEQTPLEKPQNALITKAIAYYQYASYLFSSGLLRLPQVAPAYKTEENK